MRNQVENRWTSIDEMAPAIKLLAVVEAGAVTGPAKNLIEFCRRARVRNPELHDLPAVETSVATFHRGRDVITRRFSGLRAGPAAQMPNQFVAAACEAGIVVDVIRERFPYDPSVISELCSLVERRAPDIVQTHSVKSHFLMRLSGIWRERPWVAFHHGYTTPDLKMRAYNQLDRWSLRAPALVITVSQAFARQLKGAGVQSDQIRVLHNSIDTDRAKAAVKEESLALKASLGIAHDERVALSVGRLSHEKAHADLVSAIGHLRRTLPNIKVRLLIVGDGPERGRIEQTIAALRLQDQVNLVGQVSDVSLYYELADLFVLPSLSEGSPNVLLEAMAASLPIVATAVGGVPEIVSHDESALLIAPRDTRSMAESIARLLNDAGHARSLAVNARAVVAGRYSPEARARALVEIYRQLAHDAPRPSEWRRRGAIKQNHRFTAQT
jgi:glycosyltransferase involved in cell wall biosynthesis